MYVILVGAPGVGKTASLDLPLIKLYKALCLNPGVKADQDEYNPLVSYYGMELYPMALLKDKITPESMGVEMKKVEHPIMDLSEAEVFFDNSVTLLTNELGTFMDREARGAQILLTELWDALVNYEYKTKTAGHYIIKGPYLNWIACATQSELILNMPGNARGQGLLSRIVLVYDPGSSIEEDLVYPSPNEDMINRLRETLAQIATLRGQFSMVDEVFDEVRSDIKANLPPTPTDDNMTEYVSRRSAHALKLAMCISASRSDTMMITHRDWTDAKETLFDAEQLMPVALTGFGMGKAGQTAQEIEGFIKSTCAATGRGGVPENTLRREILRKAANPGEVDTMLAVMMSAGILEKHGNMIKLVGENAKSKTNPSQPNTG